MIKLELIINEGKHKDIGDLSVQDIEVMSRVNGEGTKNERYILDVIQKRINSDNSDYEVLYRNKKIKDEFLDNFIKSLFN